MAQKEQEEVNIPIPLLKLYFINQLKFTVQ